MFIEQLAKIFGAAGQENYRTFLGLLEQNSSAKVLDLGCDDGNFTLQIGAKIGTNKLYGIEIQERIIQNLKDKGINAQCLDLNHRLPFDNESFDVVCANQIFEHLSHTDLFIREVFRILKKDGYAVISTQNLAVWHNIICILFGWQLFGTDLSDETAVGNPLQPRYKHMSSEGLKFGHCRVPTYRGLKEVFQYHKFSIEQLIGVGYYPLPMSLARVISRLDLKHSLFFTMKVRKSENQSDVV